MRGHWVGRIPDPKKYFGFIYIITDKTSGRAYVGRKQYWSAKAGVKGCKSRVVDRASKRWKVSCWKPSDWKTYKGSSRALLDWMRDHPDHEYEYKIIKQCRAKGILTYSEVQEQWKRNVLGAKLPDGQWAYFNGNIGAIRFRCPQ